MNWLKSNTDETLNSKQTHHTSPSWASYWVFIGSTCISVICVSHLIWEGPRLPHIPRPLQGSTCPQPGWNCPTLHRRRFWWCPPHLKYKIDIVIFREKIKIYLHLLSSLNDNDQSSLHRQYHGCQRPGETRSQGISKHGVFCNILSSESLPPSYVIWWLATKYWPTMAQIMACCLTTPSH